MSNTPAIVIEGTREDWPRVRRMLIPLRPHQDPNRDTTWFGAKLSPGDSEVWFRITSEAIYRMQKQTPAGRGDRLVDALVAWLSDDRDHQLEDISRFQVYVSDAGDTTIAPRGLRRPGP